MGVVVFKSIVLLSLKQPAKYGNLQGTVSALMAHFIGNTHKIDCDAFKHIDKPSNWIKGCICGSTIYIYI